MMTAWLERQSGDSLAALRSAADALEHAQRIGAQHSVASAMSVGASALADRGECEAAALLGAYASRTRAAWRSDLWDEAKASIRRTTRQKVGAEHAPELERLGAEMEDAAALKLWHLTLERALAPTPNVPS
jgi:hypothetical protein